MNPFAARPLLRRLLVIAAGVLLLYTIVGFFVLPPIVRTQAEKRLAAELGRPVSIGRVRLNPFLLTLRIERFDLREAGGASSFVSWEDFYLDFDALASLGDESVVGEFALRGFRASVLVRPDGTYNFADLLARLTPAAPRPAAPASSARPPVRVRPLRVARLAITEARLDFADQSRSQPFATVVGPLTFTLQDFHTAAARGAPYRFEATTESGERLAWSGTLQTAPLRSAGELHLENLLLPKYAPFHRDGHRLDLAEGRLSVHGRYEAGLSGTTPLLLLRDGVVQARGLKLIERADRTPVVDLASFDLTGLQLDAGSLRGKIDTIVLNGGHVRFRRSPDGTINLLDLLQPAATSPTRPKPPAATATATVPAPGPAPEITVGEFAVRDFRVDIADQAAVRPATLALTEVQLTLKQLSLAEGARLPLELSLGWAPRGRIRVQGELTLRPELSAQLRTEVADLELPPLSPYLEQFVQARLSHGTVSTTHDLRFAMKEGAPALDFAGEVRLDRFDLVDAAQTGELAGFRALALEGIKLQTRPHLALTLGGVKVAGPYARVVVRPDQTLNLAGLARTDPLPVSPTAPGIPSAPPSPPTATVPGPATPAPVAPRIAIAKVEIEDGSFSFTDRSIQPAVTTTLGGFGGTVNGLSSENLARADVALRGAVDGAGPVAITGRLDPLGPRPFVDLTLDFKNVDLLPFSAYSGRYAGFALARGKLGLDLHVQVDGRKIDSANVVKLDQFTFGGPVESPTATKLPVRLAVALLKDLDGRILIDLPVQGNLDDPEFKVGRVIGRVLVNLLTKAAVSPFKLLGSMFGGGGDELAFQEFSPGRSDLLPTERPKLETMVRALGQRPGLSLMIEGSCDPAADTHALKRVKLTERIRLAIWDQKRAADPGATLPADLKFSPEEEAAAVQAMFDREFPPGTEFGTPLPPPPEVVRPPAPAQGFFRRIVRAVSGQAKREQQAAQVENERRAAEHRAAVERALAHHRPLEEMLGRLAEKIAVEPSDLAALAAARAQRVRDHFLTPGGIAAERLFLTQSPEAGKGGQGPRVLLSLQ